MSTSWGSGSTRSTTSWGCPLPGAGEKLRTSSFARSGGGQVATALVALSRWGFRCKFVGKVGDDDPAAFRCRSSPARGSTSSHLGRCPAPRPSSP